MRKNTNKDYTLSDYYHLGVAKFTPKFIRDTYRESGYETSSVTGGRYIQTGMIVKPDQEFEDYKKEYFKVLKAKAKYYDPIGWTKNDTRENYEKRSRENFLHKEDSSRKRFNRAKNQLDMNDVVDGLMSKTEYLKRKQKRENKEK